MSTKKPNGTQKTADEIAISLIFMEYRMLHFLCYNDKAVILTKLKN